ncbi:MAG: hypothetical protein ABI199_03650 [Bacteroidia bacterium]
MRISFLFKSGFILMVLLIAFYFGNPQNKNADKTLLNPNLQSLLLHFKNTNSFPVRIDSTYMTNFSTKDSLGANEIRLLTTKWLDDSLVMNDEDRLSDFYKIDSVKAAHGFSKWAEKLDIGMTKNANAYGLQKINLNHHLSLLIWAISYSSYEADPWWHTTSINFTELNENKLGETFCLGQISFWIDTPNSYQFILSGILNRDGKLVLDKKSEEYNLDDSTKTLENTHFEYSLTNNKIILKVKNTF